jgi:hypothetical protein
MKSEFYCPLLTEEGTVRLYGTVKLYCAALRAEFTIFVQ